MFAIWGDQTQQVSVHHCVLVSESVLHAVGLISALTTRVYNEDIFVNRDASLSVQLCANPNSLIKLSCISIVIYCFSVGDEQQVSSLECWNRLFIRKKHFPVQF